MVDLESQPALSGYPLSSVDVRRTSSQETWPDAWLINGVRREPPDDEALDVLVSRYWKSLFARCQMLTLDKDAASDLAQDSWLRVLRARKALDPNGNFRAYITTIATNLWRDRNRHERRAGAMSDTRIESLDATDPNDDQPLALMDVVTEPDTLPLDEQVILKMDIDNALQRLSPHLRDALISRFLGGESAAEIGRRYDRTEQTASSWIREAVREMRNYLGESRSVAARAEDR